MRIGYVQQSEALWRARKRGRMCRRNYQSSHSKRRTDSCAAIDNQEVGGVLNSKAKYCAPLRLPFRGEPIRAASHENLPQKHLPLIFKSDGMQR